MKAQNQSRSRRFIFQLTFSYWSRFPESNWRIHSHNRLRICTLCERRREGGGMSAFCLIMMQPKPEAVPPLTHLLSGTGGAPGCVLAAVRRVWTSVRMRDSADWKAVKGRQSPSVHFSEHIGQDLSTWANHGNRSPVESYMGRTSELQLPSIFILNLNNMSARPIPSKPKDTQMMNTPTASALRTPVGTHCVFPRL